MDSRFRPFTRGWVAPDWLIISKKSAGTKNSDVKHPGVFTFIAFHPSERELVRNVPARESNPNCAKCKKKSTGVSGRLISFLKFYLAHFQMPPRMGGAAVERVYN